MTGIANLVGQLVKTGSFEDGDRVRHAFAALTDAEVSAGRCVEANGEIATLLADFYGASRQVWLIDLSRESYENHTVALVEPGIVVDVAWSQFAEAGDTARFPYIAPLASYLRATGFHRSGTTDLVNPR